jgi:hypothetical protein
MKQGKSLMELAQELTRINSAAKDYVVPVEMLKAQVMETENGNEVKINFQGENKSFGLNSWSSNQLSTYTDIPKNYFDRIKEENPSLLADSINHGFNNVVKTNKKESRMIRTLDGNIRGLLSSRYRILDAHDMLETILPVMQENGMEIVSSEITDKRLFIKALSPKLQGEITKGDVVQHGLVISTSDVGAGSVRVEPLIYRLVCTNGMISNTALRKYHVGHNQSEENIREILSDETKNITDAAFWLQVRDIVLSSLKPENFQKEIDRLRVAANMKIENFDLPRVVELAMKATRLTGENKKNSILAALASGNEGSGLTQWGLINSFTRAAYHDSFSYEESIEMERAAGNILDLNKKDWTLISSSVA